MGQAKLKKLGIISTPNHPSFKEIYDFQILLYQNLLNSVLEMVSNLQLDSKSKRIKDINEKTTQELMVSASENLLLTKEIRHGTSTYINQKNSFLGSFLAHILNEINKSKKDAYFYEMVISVFYFIENSATKEFNFSESQYGEFRKIKHNKDLKLAFINSKIIQECLSNGQQDLYNSNQLEGIDKRIHNISKNWQNHNFWMKKEKFIPEDINDNLPIAPIESKFLTINQELLDIIPENLIDSFIEILKDIVFINDTLIGLPAQTASASLSYDNFSYSIKTKIHNFSRSFTMHYFLDHYFLEKNVWQNFFEINDVWQNYLIEAILKTSPKIHKGNKDQNIAVSNNILPYYFNDFIISIYWMTFYRVLFNSVTYDPRTKLVSDFQVFVQIAKLDLSNIPPNLEKLFSYTYPNNPYLIAKTLRAIKYLSDAETIFSLKSEKKYRNIVVESCRIGKAGVVQKLSSMAQDLREIYPIVVDLLNPKDTFTALDCFEMPANAIWHWEPVGDSLGYICIASEDYDYFLAQLAKPSRRYAKYDLRIRIDYQGKICLSDIQCLDTEMLFSMGIISAYFVNLYLLQSFYDLFLQKFSEAKSDIVSGQKNIRDFSDDSAFIIKNQIKMEKYASEQNSSKESRINKKKIVQHMKSKSFFKILIEKFDCKINQGKGSEINISRIANGGRIFRLGHHGKEVEISSLKISQILSRLNIDKQDWLEAIER